MRRELVFFYGYDLSSLSPQQRNTILNAYEAKLMNSPDSLTRNVVEDFDEDSALGIRRPDGVHCPLVEMLEPYENGYEDEIEELLLQKKAVGNQFTASYDYEKLNEIEIEILRRRDAKVQRLMKMKLEDNSCGDDEELNQNGKRKLKEDYDERENSNKKPKIERCSASTTPTTPVAKLSIPFILNPESPVDTGPKEKSSKKQYYLSPMGLYRDYFGVETLAKEKEAEIHEFFGQFGRVSPISSPPADRMSASTFRSRKTSSPTRYSQSYNNEVGCSLNDLARQRISKKDEAIRRKAEQDLSKRNHATRRPSQRQPQKTTNGTVTSLKPSPALTVRESTLVVEASQLMAAKRADCVLVIDDEERLSGIFTAKDLAFRVVGDGLDARTTTVSTIMTRNPMCVKSDTSATDALNTMVARSFRHLPVCNEDGDVVGLLDITKCLYEALDKMERAYGSSKKLYDALEGVEREWSNQPTPIHQYLNVLREKMACPDLTTVLDGSMPAEIGVKTSVRDAARLMREYHTTAVLVMEHGAIAGIFTSKDIVLRVIAAGLDPSSYGHYLNLPVVDGGSILGMVDVLKLTYATMEQVYNMQHQENGHEAGGPMWNKFWNSFANDGDNESVLSDSIAPSQSASNIPPSPHSRMHNSGNISPVPEIHPSESASVMDDGSLASFPRGHEENHFTFKFKAPNGKSHRFTVDYTKFENIRATVASKLPPTVKDFAISYVDEDEDYVAMSSDEDVIDAVAMAQRQDATRVILYIQEIYEKKSSKSRQVRDDEDDEEEIHDRKKHSRRRNKNDDYHLPIPQDLILPGALLTLAIAITTAKVQIRTHGTDVLARPFNVLGIETSCDDTAVAIVNSSREILSESIKLQHEIHEPAGGITPNVAMKSHQIHLPGVVCDALLKGNMDVVKDIDVIAVTRGPGLPACLAIGLSAAKTLAAEAHALTARLTHTKIIPFPYLTLLISGGHTLILVTHGVNRHTQLGTTLDDSIGDAFDKTARLLKIPWLKGRGGGPGAALEQFALDGTSDRYKVPIPMKKDPRRRHEMNLSFSGLKTSMKDLIEREQLDLEDEKVRKDLAATFQRTATCHLIEKLELAFGWCRTREIDLSALVVSGGVASNKSIRASLERLANEQFNLPLICPPPHLCTDNGAMIAWAGVERFRAGLKDDYNIDHMPKWPIENLSGGMSPSAL
ncbi:12353_t:CDS:10 [Acaulospora colombiana]|uniref:12353_t:CDS:1 n=1 Tax=Acaulospora colombiana TaxID=27376 RepID=A0ACA9KJ07_9GLOM|nr:12353_t:CDS:10 [Acaulospora colombiana]